MESQDKNRNIKNCYQCQYNQVCEKVNNLKTKDINFHIEAHHKVKLSGKFNIEECKIPVNTGLNFAKIDAQTLQRL